VEERARERAAAALVGKMGRARVAHREAEERFAVITSIHRVGPRNLERGRETRLGGRSERGTRRPVRGREGR
jgi:hypothetical protein